MPFIPHTTDDVTSMLATLELPAIATLFDEIPEHLIHNAIPGIGAGLSEMECGQLLHDRSRNVMSGKCFIGAGAYEHHIPAAVWDITQRGEYLTSYTPYQAEASQGTLQLLWEYQTMMASLMGLAVSNASLYDGASALAEAALMALRCQPKKPRVIWVLQTLNPAYRAVLKTMLSLQGTALIEIPFDSNKGCVNVEQLEAQWQKTPQCTALIIGQPNFLGQCEAVDGLTNWAHAKDAQVIGVVNPIAMAWLKPPGQWGEQGADIACGEGQPLGVPLAGGGPYFGFLCSRLQTVRQLPGRIVGRTTDTAGKQGFTLTLQAREQHIRRAKATSNICTNQGLLVTAATIYMSLLGPQGLQRVAKTCYIHTRTLAQHLSNINGVKLIFSGFYFHEIVVQLPLDPNVVIKYFTQQGFFAGIPLPAEYGLPNTLLVCVTETKTLDDIQQYAALLQQVINDHI
jgi:glycine dehydrogenase subunit 1